jgi:hypothetical protein
MSEVKGGYQVFSEKRIKGWRAVQDESGSR